MGEPEVAEIEAVAQGFDDGDVLSLAAGAARAEETPSGNAILRFAKSRGVKPDPVRNPTVHPGLGVVAVTGTGEELCVGVRPLLLEQRVSVASAEWRIGELEALGRTIILVALGNRLVGLIALQDGIRPGARAAVQHLVDAQIEPVLMSGDSRETCEAIARSLDIEQVRPEVLPGERAEEVKRVAETGESVAVIGHAGLDDSALTAANVAVALAAAGSSSGEYDVALASDDLRDAALALALAKRTRVEARVGFGLAAIPPTLGVLIVAVGVLPPAFIPIAALLGGVVGVAHGRLTSALDVRR
jgi:P-type E1-E2 ATPase